MPPFTQTYEQTFEIEKENLRRDIDILNQISNNKYIFFEAEALELQYEGVDFLGIPKDAPVDVFKYIFIDRKTSNKYDKREFIIFELCRKFNFKGHFFVCIELCIKYILRNIPLEVYCTAAETEVFGFSF